MKFTLLGLIAVILVPLVSAQTQPFAYGRFFKIPANTVIRVRTMDEVSSETARVGDIVQMELLADVLVNGYVVVRQAATAVGQISRVKEARSMGRRGNVALTLSYIEAVTGEHILVGGNRAEKGQGKTAKIAAEVVVTTAVTGGLIGALWLFEKGHDTAIPPGTAFSVYTVGDTTIDLSLLTMPALAQAGAISMPNAPAPTSNSIPSPAQTEKPNAANQSVTVLPRPMASSSMSVPSLGLFVKTRLGLGAEVTGISRGSAAERSGLQVGNIITQIDGKKVQTIRDVSTALENRAPGSEVRLGWIFRTNLGWMPAEEGILTLSASNN